MVKNLVIRSVQHGALRDGRSHEREEAYIERLGEAVTIVRLLPFPPLLLALSQHLLNVSLVHALASPSWTWERRVEVGEEMQSGTPAVSLHASTGRIAPTCVGCADRGVLEEAHALCHTMPLLPLQGVSVGGSCYPGWSLVCSSPVAACFINTGCLSHMWSLCCPSGDPVQANDMCIVQHTDRA